MRWRKCSFVWAVSVAWLVAATGCNRSMTTQEDLVQGPRLEIDLEYDAAGVPCAFVLRGLTETKVDELRSKPEQWSQLFRVYVTQGSGGGLPPLLGSYTLRENGQLVFKPRFPLEPGLTYVAEAELGRLVEGMPLHRIIGASFLIPKPETHQRTRVTHVYPSASELPENLLKFYIHFSAPMSRGEAYQRIHLVDESGTEVADPFLELGEELWDPDCKRFTLLLDPGRIKRGLKPREEVGPALIEGKRYTLVIDRQWLDAAGNPLQQAHRKTFAVVAPDREPVDPSRWRIEPPSADSREALVVRFAEPLDHALLERIVNVQTSDGESLRGSVTITDEEKSWLFTPREPWRPGRYFLVAEAVLEDLAGNSIGRWFEVDAFDQATSSGKPGARIAFDIPAP